MRRRSNPSLGTVALAVVAAGAAFFVVRALIKPKKVSTKTPAVVFAGPSLDAERLGMIGVDVVVQPTGKYAKNTLAGEAVAWTEIESDLSPSGAAWVTSGVLSGPA